MRSRASSTGAGIGELALFYKAAARKFEDDAAFADRSRRRVVALQSGDPYTLAQWRILVDQSTRYFEAVYAKLDVTLSHGDIAGRASTTTDWLIVTHYSV
jgi:arginyl-tRNA synthetase